MTWSTSSFESPTVKDSDLRLEPCGAAGVAILAAGRVFFVTGGATFCAAPVGEEGLLIADAETVGTGVSPTTGAGPSGGSAATGAAATPAGWAVGVGSAGTAGLSTGAASTAACSGAVCSTGACGTPRSVVWLGSGGSGMTATGSGEATGTSTTTGGGAWTGSTGTGWTAAGGEAATTSGGLGQFQYRISTAMATTGARHPSRARSAPARSTGGDAAPLRPWASSRVSANEAAASRVAALAAASPPACSAWWHSCSMR